MSSITQYPILSDETIRMHETGLLCWCIPTQNSTVSVWQDILDDGDNEIILTKKAYTEDVLNPTIITNDTPVVFASKIISTISGYTIVNKTSYNQEYNLILTYKSTNDATGRVFQSGMLFWGNNAYEVLEFNHHYVTEREIYITNCIYDSVPIMINKRTHVNE